MGKISTDKVRTIWTNNVGMNVWVMLEKRFEWLRLSPQSADAVVNMTTLAALAMATQRTVTINEEPYGHIQWMSI